MRPQRIGGAGGPRARSTDGGGSPGTRPGTVAGSYGSAGAAHARGRDRGRREAIATRHGAAAGWGGTAAKAAQDIAHERQSTRLSRDAVTPRSTKGDQAGTDSLGFGRV